MFKKLLFVTIFIFGTAAPARADIATVTYVNGYIKNRWDITMPKTSARGVMDMSYLMKLIDTANEVLNGTKTSDYAHDPEYTTGGIVATTAAQYAVENLIQKKLYDPQFFFEPAVIGDTFEFSISAKGKYTIYWDDGQIESIEKNEVNTETISHTYKDGKPASAHKIGLGGEATNYSYSPSTAVISFNNDMSRLKSIDGCLGCVFKTKNPRGDDGDQPNFYRSFYNNADLVGAIPNNLLDGIYGKPSRSMFEDMFYGCSGLTKLGDKMFGNLYGSVPGYAFRNTFRDCSGLTGKIPDGLFGDFTGNLGSYAFAQTFYNCKGLTELGDKLFGTPTTATGEMVFLNTFRGCSELSGKIPASLFNSITGTPGRQLFAYTFYGCSKLTGFGDGAFCNISTLSSYTFYYTFYGCTSLTGPSATVGTDEDKQFLYERWPDATTAQVGKCYTNATKLDDYDCIPTAWGGGGTKDINDCEIQSSDE